MSRRDILQCSRRRAAAYRSVCHVCVVSSRWPALSTEVADHTPHTVLRRDLESTAAPKRPQSAGACRQNGGEMKVT